MEDQIPTVPDHDVKTGLTLSIKGYEFIDLETKKEEADPYVSVEEEVEEQVRLVVGSYPPEYQALLLNDDANGVEGQADGDNTGHFEDLPMKYVQSIYSDDDEEKSGENGGSREKEAEMDELEREEGEVEMEIDEEEEGMDLPQGHSHVRGGVESGAGSDSDDSDIISNPNKRSSRPIEDYASGTSSDEDDRNADIPEDVIKIIRDEQGRPHVAVGRNGRG